MSNAYALSGAFLVSFNTLSPSVGNITFISSVLSGETLVRIDFRPSNGLLYGLGVNATADTATLYVISTQTAVAGTIGAVNFIGDLPSGGYGFDFNPAVDRIRDTTDTGLNFRLNPNDGTLAGQDTSIVAPSAVTGVAYTNNQPDLGGVTTLYALDS